MRPSRGGKPDGIARAPTGLYNPRNWCYANSTLQALLASPEFSRQLADSEWMQAKVPRKAGEKIDPPQLMIRIISNLFHWMSTGKFETMKAQTLMVSLFFSCSRSFADEAQDYSRHLCKTTDENAQFGGHQQQDAQEFMSFVMDQLHDETNLARDRGGHVEQPSTRGRTVLQAAAAYWEGHTRLNRSLVDRYWRGLDVGTVRCLECGTSTALLVDLGARGRRQREPRRRHGALGRQQLARQLHVRPLRPGHTRDPVDVAGAHAAAFLPGAAALRRQRPGVPEQVVRGHLLGL